MHTGNQTNSGDTLISEYGLAYLFFSNTSPKTRRVDSCSRCAS